jgi:hypothetical protein
VFESRVLRRIFGPKRDEVTGGWKELHNEELLNLYSSPSIECSSQGGLDEQGMYHECGRRGMHRGHWWKSQNERDHWEDKGVGGWTILKWILER